MSIRPERMIDTVGWVHYRVAACAELSCVPYYGATLPYNRVNPALDRPAAIVLDEPLASDDTIDDDD